MEIKIEPNDTYESLTEDYKKAVEKFCFEFQKQMEKSSLMIGRDFIHESNNLRYCILETRFYSYKKVTNCLVAELVICFKTTGTVLIYFGEDTKNKWVLSPFEIVINKTSLINFFRTGITPTAMLRN